MGSKDKDGKKGGKGGKAAAAQPSGQASGGGSSGAKLTDAQVMAKFRAHPVPTVSADQHAKLLELAKHFKTCYPGDDKTAGLCMRNEICQDKYRTSKYFKHYKWGDVAWCVIWYIKGIDITNENMSASDNDFAILFQNNNAGR